MELCCCPLFISQTVFIAEAHIWEERLKYLAFFLLLNCRFRFWATPNSYYIIFVLCCRAPDSARVKAKMMYASTKDFFKTHLDGISGKNLYMAFNTINNERKLREQC